METKQQLSPVHDLYPQSVSGMSFAGWRMPRDFDGILREHRAVRSAAGLFDISHMGRLIIRGADAVAQLQQLFSRSLVEAEVGQALYGFFLDAEGRALDDDIVYIRSPEELWLVVNAAARDKIYLYLRGNLPELEVQDVTHETVLFALQGPEAGSYYDLLPAELAPPKKLFRASWDDDKMIATTGYTGEAGCEIWLPVESGRDLFQHFIDRGVQLCGLGARDSLRLEMGFPLHGNELTEEIDPVTAGLVNFIDWEHEFVGREALEKIHDGGPAKELRGLVAAGRRSPRQGQKIRLAGEEDPLCHVTSGGFSPLLKQGVAIGLLPADLPGDETLEVNIRSTWHTVNQKNFPLHQ